MAFYIYNSWDNEFDLKTSEQDNSVLKTSIVNNDDIYKQLMKEIVIDGKIAIKDPPHAMHSMIIPLVSKSGPHGFLYLSDEKESGLFGLKEYKLIKQESERLINSVNHYRLNRNDRERNAFLFDFASRINSIINKKDILHVVAHSSAKLYPSFSYYILLSQDYEADNSLPVKTLEFSDGGTRRVSTQAFLTGGIQIENRIKEKNTCLYAPLNGKQGVYGVLQIITAKAVNFPEEEITFITQFANTAG